MACVLQILPYINGHVFTVWVYIVCDVTTAGAKKIIADLELMLGFGLFMSWAWWFTWVFIAPTLLTVSRPLTIQCLYHGKLADFVHSGPVLKRGRIGPSDLPEFFAPFKDSLRLFVVKVPTS